MNNIYVDELPNRCEDCPLHNEDNGWCQVLICYTDDVPTDCPLKPLTNRLAEERKKVVQEIITQISKLKKLEPKHDIGYDCDDVMLSYLEISEKLDQIERGG